MIRGCHIEVGRFLTLFRGSMLIGRLRCNQFVQWKSRCESVACRDLSSTHQKYAGSSWRYRQGESQMGHDYGPLVDLPDWSYVDGRPAPQGSGWMKRQNQQRQMAKRIDRLATEMTEAIQRSEATDNQRNHRRNQHKLKPKGQFLHRELAYSHK